jgi:alkylation response protein AidB-like acyl-CoA dehydrogenase
MARDQPQTQSADWPDLVALGLPALGLPEAEGGSGAGAPGFHAVLEMLGRHLVTSPFLSSALLCTQLVLRCATPQQQARLLPALADGALVLALASGEPQTDYLSDAMTTTARPGGDTWRIEGRKTMVPNGGMANAWLVTARTPEGDLGLFLLDESMPDLTVRRYPFIDGSTGCDLALRDVSVPTDARLGGTGAAVELALQAATDAAVAGQCAESIGLQAALLEATTNYVKERRQFGVAIGSFQVVQHRLVEMLVALEQARSLAWHAASVVDGEDAAARSMAVSAAKVRCIESARFIGMQAIHLHGGMGMTDELPVGRYVKRLLAIEHSLGDTRHHLARFAALTQTDIHESTAS